MNNMNHHEDIGHLPDSLSICSSSVNTSNEVGDELSSKGRDELNVLRASATLNDGVRVVLAINLLNVILCIPNIEFSNER